MPRVMIRCPLTDVMVPVGLTAEIRRHVPASGALERCEACGRRHLWHRPETVFEGQEPRYRGLRAS